MKLMGRKDDPDRGLLEDEENLDWPEDDGEDLEEDLLDEDEWDGNGEDLDVEEDELKWAIHQEGEDNSLFGRGGC
jgi:hypothetical protein